MVGGGTGETGKGREGVWGEDSRKKYISTIQVAIYYCLLIHQLQTDTITEKQLKRKQSGRSA